jgi:hypothetical protein
MAIRAWVDGDLRLAMRLLQWANPQLQPEREAQRDTPRSTPARSPIPLHGGMFHPQAA